MIVRNHKHALFHPKGDNVMWIGGKLAWAAGLCLGASLSVQAGSATFNLNQDPAGQFDITGSAYWSPTDGVNNSGYLVITEATGGQRGAILFPDFDNGLIVKAFTFSMDMRIGNGTAPPADGFSVNYARAGDPTIASIEAGGTDGFAASPGGEANLPEEGTTTGLGIGFDTWDSGSGDVVGISIRVDNTVIAQKALPTRHGALNDATSMQTGPQDPNDPTSFSTLGWAKFEVELKEDGKLTVRWKDTDMFKDLPTAFFPSPGRLVFCGRTGGSYEHHHIDNIVITTVPANTPLMTSLTATPFGFVAELRDAPPITVNANSIKAKFNGQEVSGLAISKSDITTTLKYVSSTPLPSGSSNTVEIAFSDSAGGTKEVTREIVTPVYTYLPASFTVPASTVSMNSPGFRARIHQIEVTRGPGDANSIVNAERQLVDGYIDPATGQPYPNVADLTGAVNGLFDVPTLINWNQDAPAGIGNFSAESTPAYEDEPIPGIPGTTGINDNIVAEILSYLELPAGQVQLGVNSDDGFKVSFGSNPKDAFAPTAGSFNGGRGASDTIFNVVVEQAGIYPVRLAWWEGGGGANVEFFFVDSKGAKVLVNERTATEQIKAYRTSSTPMPAYVRSASPAVNQTDVAANEPIVIELSDDGTTVEQNSIKVALNGAPLTPTINKSGKVTTVRATLATPLPANSANTVTLVYGDSAQKMTTNTWQYVVANYATLPVRLGSPVGSGNNSQPGFKMKVHQLDVVGTVGAPNMIRFSEAQVAGLFGANVADQAGAVNGYFQVDGVINFDQDSAAQGNFTANSTPPRPEEPIPGIPGSTSGTDNIAAEIITYIEFPEAGYYRMGFNSDDGFRVTGTDTLARPSPLEITAPASLAGFVGALSAGPENRGTGTRMPVTPITAQVVMANPPDATTDLVNSNEVQGKIVMIDRGAITFDEKIRRAAKAGAVGVIMVNNQDANSAAGVLPILMGSVTTTNLPAVMIMLSDGARIKAQLASGVTATLAETPEVSLGEFNDGRGASDTIFSFLVPQAGVYPFRALWFEGGGGANLEWFSLDSAGVRHLLNDRADSSALKTYRSRTYTPPAEEATIKIARNGNQLVITYTGTLESAAAITGPWTTVAGATSPYTLSASEGARFLRCKQ